MSPRACRSPSRLPSLDRRHLPQQKTIRANQNEYLVEHGSNFQFKKTFKYCLDSLIQLGNFVTNSLVSNIALNQDYGHPNPYRQQVSARFFMQPAAR